MESLHVNEHRKIKSQFQLGKQKKYSIGQSTVTLPYLILIYCTNPFVKITRSRLYMVFHPKIHCLSILTQVMSNCITP